MNNLDDYNAQREKAREAARLKRIKDRKAMLAVLRAAGVTKVKAEYHGSGDEGNIEKVILKPENTGFKDADETLNNLLWDIAYEANPGFEINEGGDGIIKWKIAEDDITITHSQHHIKTRTRTHKNV